MPIHSYRMQPTVDAVRNLPATRDYIPARYPMPNLVNTVSNIDHPLSTTVYFLSGTVYVVSGSRNTVSDYTHILSNYTYALPNCGYSVSVVASGNGVSGCRYAVSN